MAAKPKLSPEEWSKVKETWEGDAREGYAWLVSELAISVSAPGVRKTAIKCGWRKSKPTVVKSKLKHTPLEKDFQKEFLTSFMTGEISLRHGWPPVVRVFSEYRIGVVRCDVVAFHEDGSISICELKREGSPLRDYMTGIGQLMSASVQLGISLVYQGVRRTVRLILSVPGEVNEALGYACERAGVEYLPFESRWDGRELAQSQVAEMNSVVTCNG